MPSNFTVFNTPRETGRGGGVASIYKNIFICTRLKFEPFSSFELQVFEMHLLSPVLCAVVYRPPGFNKNFLSELSMFLADIVAKYDKILILGDFSIHICCPTNSFTKDFLNLIDCWPSANGKWSHTYSWSHARFDSVTWCQSVTLS